MPRKTQKQKINKSTKRESLSFGDQELLKKFLIPLEQIIFNLSEENLESSVQQTMELFDSSYPYSFNLIISKLVYFSFCSKQEVNDVYLKYLKNIQTQEEKLKKNNSNIVKCFVDYISKIKSHEAYYFIEKMIDEDLIDEEVTKNIESKYFAHHQNDKVFYSPKRRYYWNHFHENTIDQSLKNARDVKKNDWELHKKLINEGMNENEISKIIRNDDIEKLQEIVSQNDFDFNQRIEPSLYEKNSYINENSVTLIDYAAFFGSVKCFKFLLLNNCNIESSGKYAIAGGNLEIIHLCEQNHSSFKDAYVTAIAFHRNDIFKYIYENEIEKINKPKSQNFPNHIYYRSYSPTFFGIYSSENHNFGDDQILKYLIYLCIVYSNYEILSFFEEKDNLKIDDFLFSICASTGNLYLFKYFLQINEVPKEILSGAFESENIELIKYVIDLEGIDINAKSDIFLFSLEYIPMIFGMYIYNIWRLF